MKITYSESIDRVTQVCEFLFALDKHGICKIMHEIGEVVQNMFF